MNETILIIDDEADIRNLIRGILTDEGYNVEQASSAREAYREMEHKLPDLLVLDIWLQGSDHDGLQVLANIKKRHPFLPVIMISGHGTIETAVSSIKLGAYDFIEKPFKSDRLLLMIQRALEAARLRQENAILRKKVSRPPELIGVSAVIQNLKQILERVAPANSRVLLSGEAGSGKDVVARTLHALSGRKAESFQVINCATLRPDRLEAELFGADGQSVSQGLFYLAEGGTVLFDEIADMPLDVQGAILRVLQEQRMPGGGNRREIDVRIMASTSRNLEQMVSDGLFRQDLYYRLNVVPIIVPPLCDRLDDVPLLVEHFTSEIAHQSGLVARKFSSSAIAALQSYNWPGNVRQLRNAVEWTMIMKTGAAADNFHLEDLPPEITGRGDISAQDTAKLGGNFMMLPLREAREIFERDYLLAQIGRFGGNISKTAQFIGMERSALHRKLKSLSIGEREEGEMADNVSSIKKRVAGNE